ncbi:MAG: hydroxymethylbilane synthase [Bacteroidia bacterium]
MRNIIIGTRGSDLALWQANYTKAALEKLGHVAELKIISTQGDRTQQWNTGFDKLEGKGFFTKELEDELLNGSIDLAVHSHKDLPTEHPVGLIIAAVSQREDPSELLLIRKEAVDEKKKFGLKHKALVGTSASRRKSQLLAFREDLQLADLRGNVPTRVNKLREGKYDAIMLACAGLERLETNLEEFHVEKLNPREFVPAPAQGVLAWQIREKDEDLYNILQKLNNDESEIALRVERKILNLFEGGCHMPIGAYCEIDRDNEERPLFKVWAAVADEATSQPKQLYLESNLTDGLAEKVVARIKGIAAKKVFITRNLRASDYFYRALSRLSFAPSGKSLIEFKTIEIKELPAVDWVFFSSKHAVKYFFMQKPALRNVKFGCISKQTAQELRNIGKRADFIGQSTDTKLIGKQFASLIGSSKVLFPVAKESMRSVQLQFPKKDNAIDLVVYQTVKHAVKVDEDTDIIVFTSPSNVDAFFEKNKLLAHQKAVGMGDATANALERKGIKRCAKPISFDDLGLVQAVLGLS